MSDQNIYFPLWKKYLPIIAMQMKNAVNGNKEIKFYRNEFEGLGNRKIADYKFNLEIKNGKAVNDIRGIAVARGLFEILQQDESCKKLFQDRNYKLSMGKEFILRISILKTE
jgi:hypothetical protein